jgi:AcrR family transcriptional regulator
MAPLAEIDRHRSTAADTTEGRVIDAMLRCIARWGVAKTTGEDVAREAGVSRATLYRAFPGGRRALYEAILRHELGRFVDSISVELDAADSLEDALVTGMVGAGRFLRDHDALQYLLRHEPERVLPAFAFHRLDRVLAAATALCAPHLARFTSTEAAAIGADWAARLVLSYSLHPSPVLDLADEASVRRVVGTYLAPGLSR